MQKNQPTKKKKNNKLKKKILIQRTCYFNARGYIH